MKKKRWTCERTLYITIVLASIIYSIGLVDSFGATAPYWNDKPLYLIPGETREFPIILQNMIGGKDIVLIAEIESGQEIAELIDENKEYKVPFGKNDIKVNMKITAPENAKIGDKYEVRVVFRSVSDSTEGNIQISAGVKNAFYVIVREQDEIKSTDIEFDLNLSESMAQEDIKPSPQSNLKNDSIKIEKKEKSIFQNKSSALILLLAIIVGILIIGTKVVLVITKLRQNQEKEKFINIDSL